ncbi:MAG: hypothetical protein QXU32_05500 [Nitrososphaerales archaeon]
MKERKSLRAMIIVAAIAIVLWGVFNLYPKLQPLETKPRVYPQEVLWTYGFGIGEGSHVVYDAYHTSIGHNVTVSYTVIDTENEDGTWKVAVEITNGKDSEAAYVFTAGSILPVSGSRLVGNLEKFEVATKMPVAEFLMGLEDQPLVVGASWQMAFLSPDNTYTRASIVENKELDGQDVYVLKYGPEKNPSFTLIAKNYPIPLRDEYIDPLSGEIISIYRLVAYEK